VKSISKKEVLNSNRIAVFGYPATGKSILAETLRKITGLPLYYLDRLRYEKDGFTKRKETLFLSDYQKIIRRKKWIAEGNALDFIDGRIEKADLLIFFDSNKYICVLKVIMRYVKELCGLEIRRGFNQYEKGPKRTSIRWILGRYNSKIIKLRPRLEKYKGKLVVIRSYKELMEFIAMLK